MTETKEKKELSQAEKKVRLQVAVFGFLLGFVIGALVFAA